jgi:hypothetical protein
LFFWIYVIFFLIGIVGDGVQLGPLATATTNDLLCQPRLIMMMEKLVEWLARETEVLGENPPQCRFVHNKHHMLSEREPGPPRWEARTNRLSCGTALDLSKLVSCLCPSIEVFGVPVSQTILKVMWLIP